MIEVKDLTVQVPASTRVLLQGLSWRLHAGEVLAVLGPNGRGKTTLLRTLLGHIPAGGGSVRRAGHAAYVPQLGEAGAPYGVLDMVAMGRARHLRWWQGPRAQDLAQARRCLAQVGLAALAAEPFASLSGGQQQLVCLARALASESPIIVLDEPMAALDLRNQDVVLRMLRQLAQTQGLCIIFSTHSPQHALHIADHTLMLYPHGGEFGPTKQVCVPTRLAQVYQMPVALGQAVDAAGRTVTGVIPLFSHEPLSS